MTNYLDNNTYYIYDSSVDAFKEDKLSHFALGDALIRAVGNGEAPAALHFWPIENLVILGMMDTRLPYLQDGIRLLRDSHSDVIVRNAGGLAVVADDGILNFSLVLPDTEKRKLSINDGYTVMKTLIEQTFADSIKTIAAFEISDSYCPGDFDLSIDGKKFAGIAQRRFKNGVSIMIYMSINGDQQKRGALIRRFYELGLRQETTRWHFPTVNPDSMANLSDLLGMPLTVDGVKERILTVLAENGNVLIEGPYSTGLLADYRTAYEKMKKRNEQIDANKATGIEQEK